MFAVGLCMLEAMTFEPAMESYDLNSLMIKPDYHKRKLLDLKQTSYSARLIQLVMASISNEPENRPSFQFFLKQIKQW